MPTNEELIASTLGLMPGDIFVTEMPYEDPTIEDFSPVINFKQFDAGHVAIWTGSGFTKPLAHSVSEGYQLPGIRLTKTGDGRHLIFRPANRDLAEKIALIARRWAMGNSVFDEQRFEQVYPKGFWDSPKNYDKHKYDFFSIPFAKILGPATPYPFRRASAQVHDRARNPELKKFTEDSLRRAIKFSARSDIIGPISKGMRCTSFVVATIQAAVLHDITEQTISKTSFKDFKQQPFNVYANKVLSPDWKVSEKGKQLQEASKNNAFNKIFPSGLAIDSKYAIPNDLFSALSQNPNDWLFLGSTCLFQGKIINLTKNNEVQEQASCSSNSSKEIEKASELATPEEAQKQQLAQEKLCAYRISLFATPLREKDKGLLSNNEEFNGKKLACSRTLKFD
ncbi:MAG: hypothetical protein PSV35_08435 [bacterium]|nr:hypothetical protein [bacterium]